MFPKHREPRTQKASEDACAAVTTRLFRVNSWISSGDD